MAAELCNMRVWRDKIMTNNMPLPGRKYRHYKGNEYLVLHIARHSETLEELVVYQALYGEMGIWVRPLIMFAEKVNVDGEARDRFALLAE